MQRLLLAVVITRGNSTTDIMKLASLNAVVNIYILANHLPIPCATCQHSIANQNLKFASKA